MLDTGIINTYINLSSCEPATMTVFQNVLKNNDQCKVPKTKEYTNLHENSIMYKTMHQYLHNTTKDRTNGEAQKKQMDLFLIWKWK